MDFICTFPHKGKLFALYKFKNILLFPNSGVSLFPRNEGIHKLSEEELKSNINLSLGLASKNRATYLRRLKYDKKLW